MTNRSDNNKLRAELEAFSIELCSAVHDWRNSGRAVQSATIFTMRPNLSLHYSVDMNLLFQVPIEHGEEMIWDRKNYELFFAEKVEPSTLYQQLLLDCTSNPAATSLLRNFAGQIAHGSFRESGDTDIHRQIEILLRDIASEKQPYKARIWLTGITVNEQRIDVSNYLVFRTPILDDLRERISDEHVHSAHFFQNETRFSCIGELSLLAHYPREAQLAADRLLTALRLFKLGSVSSSRIEILGESFSSMASSRMGAPALGGPYEYSLSSSDTPHLASFLSKIEDKLPSPYEIPGNNPDFLSTAIGWYTDSIVSAIKPLEGRVASAVASLEALYLSDNPQSEITYRLIQRVAALLSNFGNQPLTVRDTLNDAYDIRSRYVHGALQKKRNSHDRIVQILSEVAEYARKSNLIMVQLIRLFKIDHKDLLTTLVDSLIDEASRTKLKEACDLVQFT